MLGNCRAAETAYFCVSRERGAYMAGVLAQAYSIGRADRFGANRSGIGAVGAKIWPFKVSQKQEVKGCFCVRCQGFRGVNRVQCKYGTNRVWVIRILTSVPDCCTS